MSRQASQPRRRRRAWILVPIIAVVLLLGAGAAYIGISMWQAKVDTVGEVAFDRPLAIPPLAESSVNDDGERVFDLTLQRGETDFGKDEPTETWGINGSYLGPTLRAERGEDVKVNVTNDVGETSTIHWHGMHLPARMDGGPHQMVDPGDTWSPHWTIDQPAATLWYHPHPHGETAKQVYRGLAGMFILDDPESEVASSLPNEYGVDDIPVVVQDKKFDGSQLDESEGFLNSVGILGDTVLVNGTPGPFLDVTTERIRLRLLNGSNARPYNFHFDDDRPYRVIGTDGGLLPKPVERTHLEVSPGERAEIVVDVEPGETTTLRSAPLESSTNRMAGAVDRLDILELRAADELGSTPDVPQQLAPAPDIDASEVTETREFGLADNAINGDKMDMSRIDLTIEAGATERWTVRNLDEDGHNFHVHDVQFVIESLDGDEPPPHLRGWKDTVYIPDGMDATLLVRFSDFTDPDFPYMYHCHMLRHEDRGMMGQFVVVEPGGKAGEISSDHDH